MKIAKIILMFGESNIGGMGLNTDAASNELIYTNVKIFNNNNLTLESLQIGVNNLLSHPALESYSTTRHGLELGISNSIDKIINDVVIVKAGCGGTRVEHWLDELAFNNVLPFQVMIDRLQKTIILLKNTGYTNIFLYPILWIGINDAINNTNPDTFETKINQLINRFFNNVTLANNGLYVIRIPRNTTNKINIDNKLQNLASISNIRLINVDNAELIAGDDNHYSYQGLKRIAKRLLDNGLLFYK